MKLKTLGRDISVIEVSNISKHGFWVYVNYKEYFFSYDQYPWFKEAKTNEIFDVQILHRSHLYWPQCDLELNSLENP